jgi:microcystin-dependent protein
MHEGDLYVERDAYVRGDLSVGKDLHSTNFYATGNYYLDKFVLIPAGTIIMSASVTEPGGWLDCNGQILAKGAIGSVYYDLFLAIGYTYSTVGISGEIFKIPDMQGRVGVGLGSGTGLTPRTLADISGSETHTLTVAQMPNHSHTNNSSNNLGLATVTGANTASSTSGLDNSTTEMNLFERPVALNIDSIGGGLPHNNMQPYVVLRYLIKY